MDEIRKITFDSPGKADRGQISTRKVAMAAKKKKRFSVSRKQLLIVLGVLLVTGVLSTFFVVLPAIKTIQSAKATYAQAKLAVAAAKTQNVEVASVELVKTKEYLAQTQKDLGAFSYVRFIPLVGGYYSDADHLTRAGMAGLDAATAIVDSVKPYADLLGLKGQGSFVMGSAEQRIQTAVLTMGKITPRIDSVVESLKVAQQEIDQVDTNRYPAFLVGGKVRDQIVQLQTLTDAGVTSMDQARPLIKVLPTLLGESEEKKYLVLFQNDKELRPTGGFMTAYSVFSINKGIIKVERSDDIYALDATIPNHPPAPAPILKYLPKVSTFNLRDTNLSPDFVESMETFLSLYNRAGDRQEIDGIIALDTNVLVSTIKILDDEIQAGGFTFTSKEDERCKCPQAIYVLENDITRPVNYVKTERKEILGTLLYAIMQKAMKSSPKLYWGPLFQDFITQTNQKHVLFYLFDKDAQSGIESLNAAGRIKPFDGDYLHINEANMGGAKSNLYVQEKVEQKYDVKGDRTIEKTITINYKNPFPPSDCNLERGGLCLNAPLRNWVRIYVPKGSELIDSKGSEVKMTTYDELGKTVFEGFLTIQPMGAKTFTLHYRLPFKLENGSSLPVLIQKQPGPVGHEYTITDNGRTLQTFPLTADKEIKLHF